MLDICYVRGTEIDIMFNANKSSLFVVGKACDVLIDTMRIGQDTINWSKSMKYLGVQFNQVMYYRLITRQLCESFMLLKVAVWCSGNALVLINAVALHRARLVLGWVTAFG